MSVKEKYGLTDKQVKQYQLMAKHPEVVAKAKEQAKKGALAITYSHRWDEVAKKGALCGS